MNELFEATQKELKKEGEISAQIVRSSAKQLLKMKQQQTTGPEQEKKEEETQIVDIDNWEIEYDEGE